MTNKRDDIIEDILVDSELAKQLVPNKFKFTSKQGRVRRQKLLMGARKLSETRAIHNISLADVCKEAGIPRASAYHFFPNVESIFLALRFLNAIELIDELKTVKASDYSSWQDFFKAAMLKTVEVFEEDPTKAKLSYSTNTPDFEGEEYGTSMNVKIAQLMFSKLSSHYDIPESKHIEKIMLVAYAIIDSVFTMSFRRYGKVTTGMVQEATTAVVAYLRCYLPEYIPVRDKEDDQIHL